MSKVPKSNEINIGMEREDFDFCEDLEVLGVQRVVPEISVLCRIKQEIPSWTGRFLLLPISHLFFFAFSMEGPVLMFYKLPFSQTHSGLATTGTGRPGKSWLQSFPLNIPSNSWNKSSSARRRDEPLRYKVLIAAACISDDNVSSDRPEPQQGSRFEEDTNNFFNDAEGDTSESIFGPVGDCDESHVMGVTPHELNSEAEINRYASQGKTESSSPLPGQSPEEAFSTLNSSLDGTNDTDATGDDSDFLIATPGGSLEKYRLYNGGASPKIVAIGRWELTG